MPEKNNFDITTQKAFEENIKTITVAGTKDAGNNTVIPRKRGRPPKVSIAEIQEEETIVCPKCKLDDPGDWIQCNGICPMPESPFYKKAKIENPFGENLPPDPWGKWKRFNVSETSKVFLDWFDACKKIALDGWELKIRNMKKFLLVYMSDKTHNQRPFAFVKKSTGDIHTPATAKYPFEHFAGNIVDPETRLSILTPYGVKTHWSFLPTHENFVAGNTFLTYSDSEIEIEDDDNGE